MKKHIFSKAVLLIGLAAIMLLAPITALANTDTPAVARTRAWDTIPHTLGGVPESVRLVEYSGVRFYLGTGVTDADFLAVLDSEVSIPTTNPIYILWNADKTILLVHPIIFAFDDILTPVAIPTVFTSTPAETQPSPPTPRPAMTIDETIEFMLTAEYADMVRTEFYRLLNEYRVANGRQELAINLELQDYADIRANELRTRFSHTRPNGTAAGSGWHNSRNTLNTRYAESVIGVGVLNADPTETARSILERWMNSAPHNRHLLFNFNAQTTMAFGITPQLDSSGRVTSGAVFATGF